ncbi:hypothetical protein [Methylocystis sp. SC2]|uniref:hypothetical protein n=1 Tax=Methylocystis sp. (strain SC2) TaxID=187303 RepID=UPI00027AF3BF|nr:hypothetical protein [Methylocystis sp. SC2]CCJ07235.1 Uncharacterized protein BN69_1784 [Methylocystis sp. SC2]
MAVSLRDRRPPPKADTIETRARYAWHDIEGDWRAASPRPAGSRRQSYATASDRNFERVERFFYIGAAALVVVGSAIVVGSAFWGELPQNGAPADSMRPQKIAPPAPRGAPSQARSGAPAANLRSQEQPPSIIAGPVAPSATPERAASAQVGAESAPGAQASNPLAASIANLELQPEFLNDGLGGKRRSARRGEQEESAATANVAADQEPPASEARSGKCYVRISGRVLNSGACQISRKGGAVVFQYSGQTLTLAPARGKSWSVALGGKNLGNVYKSGACWGSKSAYICDRSG